MFLLRLLPNFQKLGHRHKGEAPRQNLLNDHGKSNDSPGTIHFLRLAVTAAVVQQDNGPITDVSKGFPGNIGWRVLLDPIKPGVRPLDRMHSAPAQRGEKPEPSHAIRAAENAGSNTRNPFDRVLSAVDLARNSSRGFQVKKRVSIRVVSDAMLLLMNSAQAIWETVHPFPVHKERGRNVRGVQNVQDLVRYWWSRTVIECEGDALLPGRPSHERITQKL